MAGTCRAVVFHGDGTWALRDDFAVPTPPPGGAVLAVEAVGLCHSDVAQLAGHKHTYRAKSARWCRVTRSWDGCTPWPTAQTWAWRSATG